MNPIAPAPIEATSTGDDPWRMAGITNVSRTAIEAASPTSAATPRIRPGRTTSAANRTASQISEGVLMRS
jgi:hypothetical protein